MAELKPCPFCGSYKFRIEKYGKNKNGCYRIICDSCNAGQHSWHVFKYLAIKAWNRRVPIKFKAILTNGDRIRQMTDEELAKLMTYVDTNICDFCASRHSNTYYDCEEESCEKCVLAWLKQEVSEDERH